MRTDVQGVPSRCLRPPVTQLQGRKNKMSLEDRIRTSVDQAIGTLVRELLEHTAEDRQAAVAAARETALEDGEQAAQTRVADAEARVRASMDEAFAVARAEDRKIAAREIRSEVESEVEQKIHDALAAADARMKLVLADAEARAAEAVQASVAAARVGEREVGMAGVSRLLESIRGLDGATTLSEVLDALALGAAREAARVAVVVLRGERIQGWKVSGFGPRDAQPKLIDLPLADAGVIGLAVGAARTVTTRDGHAAAVGPGFEHLPADRMGLAVPVIVGGRVVGVIYADGVSMDGHERPVPSGWPEVVEVLARHAGRCLEALTSKKIPASKPGRAPHAGQTGAGVSGAVGVASATSTPGATGAAMQHATEPDVAAKRAARLLVSEIRLYHGPAVDEGRREGNLLQRLAPEIARARRDYDDQVPAGIRTRTDFFQQELIRTLAGGDATLLGNFA